MVQSTVIGTVKRIKGLNGTVKRFKFIFANKGNGGTKFGAPLLFIPSCNSHFFNKTDLEQYFFNRFSFQVYQKAVEKRYRYSELFLPSRSL